MSSVSGHSQVRAVAMMILAMLACLPSSVVLVEAFVGGQSPLTRPARYTQKSATIAKIYPLRRDENRQMELFSSGGSKRVYSDDNKVIVLVNKVKNYVYKYSVGYVLRVISFALKFLRNLMSSQGDKKGQQVTTTAAAAAAAKKQEDDVVTAVKGGKAELEEIIKVETSSLRKKKAAVESADNDKLITVSTKAIERDELASAAAERVWAERKLVELEELKAKTANANLVSSMEEAENERKKSAAGPYDKHAVFKPEDKAAEEKSTTPSAVPLVDQKTDVSDRAAVNAPIAVEALAVKDASNAAENTMEKIKSFGAAGVTAYILTEIIFWAFSIPIIIASYHNTNGEWLSFADEGDRVKILAFAATFATGARLAVPVRFAAAIALVPTIKSTFFRGDDSEASLKFLEANPYWDQSNIPLQLFKAKEPHIGKVVSVKRIVGAQATGETCNIIIDHQGKMPYWEGQSYGVLPPGINPKNGKPHTNRLYSIASTRYGDDMKGTTATLCVRRATYWCPELKADDPAKKGVCSNFLCDTKPGDEIMLTGPAGKVMLMPEEKPETDLIMVATGTGIAPYRGFIRRLFTEDTPAAKAYKGTAWLFLGVANKDALLYDDEWQKVKEKFPNNFKLDYALSREGPLNKKGGKMYIQDKVEEYADDVFARMEKGAHMYFCGLKGMMPGILEMLEGVAKSKGKVWAEVLKEWKERGQWHVEVY